MKFGPAVQKEMLFKDISYLELWQPFVQRTVTICAILEEGVMRNNSVKFFFYLDKWFRRKCYFISGALTAMFSRA